MKSIERETYFTEYHKLIREFEKIIKLKSNRWTDQDWEEFFKWDKFLNWDKRRQEKCPSEK